MKEDNNITQEPMDQTHFGVPHFGIIGSVDAGRTILERVMMSESSNFDGVILIGDGGDIHIPDQTLEKLKEQFGENMTVHILTPEDALSQTKNPFEREPIPFKIQPLVENCYVDILPKVNKVEKQQKKYAERHYSKNLRKK